MADGEGRRAGETDAKLLEMLVCPLSKATLEWRPERNELISRPARLAYPVREGVPILLPDEARLARLPLPKTTPPRRLGLLWPQPSPHEGAIRLLATQLHAVAAARPA